MEEALVAWLLADGPLAAIVAARINWNERPQGKALPAVVLQRITGIRDYHMQGPSGLVRSLVQIDCWGKTFEEVIAASRAVIARLSGVGMGEVSSIQLASLINERQGFDGDPDASERFHRASLDFELWHSE